MMWTPKELEVLNLVITQSYGIKRNTKVKFMKKVAFFYMDEEILKRMVTEENAISDAVDMKGFTLVHLMTLPDPSLLPQLNRYSQTGLFGGDEQGYRNIKHISHLLAFPQLMVKVRIVGGEADPISVPRGNYTPENRGQGLAKALVNSMSRRLYSLGFPVLFTNLGFTEDPQYRAAGYQFNY
uniref:Uncharacterized protein n=1 Tax=Hucho hucho TaxID=62062 RepID=A0A4W5J7R2_9TELE